MNIKKNERNKTKPTSDRVSPINPIGHVRRNKSEMSFVEMLVSRNPIGDRADIKLTSFDLAVFREFLDDNRHR